MATHKIESITQFEYTNYEKIKADLLAFGKKNGACVKQYQRLYKAESTKR